ncbi:MAG: LLM class flavin-dependent oxidoreductase [Deltaproteobacteria bacterium]|nr:LLM class flavin-dependent oxidoreductase [Deltaproteobacteria bacterium]
MRSVVTLPSTPRFGVYLPQVGFSFEEILARARRCEELGIESLWLMDHLYPPELPGVASFEGWTLATALLAHTERLRVGHLVLSATFRTPALLGKMATTLDVVSGGRLELGLGSGSYAREHERAGIPFGDARTRARQLEESLEVVSAMFGRVASERPVPPNLPLPAQPKGPPIHVGGAGERLILPLVARFADVWNCPTYALASLGEKRAVLDRACRAVGRDPAAIATSLEAVLVLVEREDEVEAARALAERRFGGPGWGLREGAFVGTPEAIVLRIEHFRRLGVGLFVFFLHDRGEERTLRLLAERLIPAATAAAAREGR